MSRNLRVLYPLVTQPVGGVGTFLKSMFENTEGYEIAIIESSKDLQGEFNSYFIERNVPIVLFPHISKQVEYFKSCKKFYKENAHKYDIVHVQSPANALPHMYYAKKYGIKHRIYHSHSVRYSDTSLKSMRNAILLKLALLLATDYFACSKMAGEKILSRRKFKIIPNSIDVRKFLFSSNKRISLRKHYSISNEKIVIACIGTMNDNKNQKLLIEMMRYLSEEKYELIFIGTGVNEEKLKEQAKYCRNIKFLGRQENISEFYSMVDVIAIPSIFEGFSIVSLEAQASGLPIISSITLEGVITDLTKQITYVTIDRGASKSWAEIIKKLTPNSEKKRKKLYEKVSDTVYDKENARILLMDSYKKIVGGKNEVINKI